MLLTCLPLSNACSLIAAFSSGPISSACFSIVSGIESGFSLFCSVSSSTSGSASGSDSGSAAFSSAVIFASSVFF